MELNVSQSQNILNWYNFNKEDNILEIGKNSEELTKMLKEKVKSINTITEDIKKFNLKQKYDKILLIGIIPKIKEIFGENLKLEEVIKELEKYLKDDGKFIIALDNKFGLRYFVGNPENILNKKFVSLIGYSNESEKIETFTKKRLEKIFIRLGYKYKFYYPLPDYKMPDVIFTDEQLPKYNSVDKYNSYPNENSTIIANEIDIFREILKNNPEMFAFFTNSFLVELSKEEIKKSYKYISYNNLRKKEYQLITKISNDFVEKEPVSKKANDHYENIKQNIKILNDLEIKTLDYIENNKIMSRYINQELLLNNILAKKLEENNMEEFEQIIEKYINTLMINTYKEEDYNNTVFNKYKIEIENKEIIKDLNFLENGLWDMTFKNCFYIDDEIYFFDQEWNEKNVPMEYILYRSILYTISLRRYIDINTLFEKYSLTKYIDLFKKLDDKIQDKIKDNDIWEFYNRNCYIDIDATKQEIMNLNIREEAKDKAIENLNKEIDKLKANINCLIKQNENMLKHPFRNKIKNQIKKIAKRN